MKISRIIITMILVALSSTDAYGSSLPKDINLKKLKGGTLSLAEIKNKPAIIEFWASWCDSCGASMEAIHKWMKTQKNVRYIAVSVDNTLDEAKEFFKVAANQNIKDVEANAVFDADAKLATAIKAPSLPTTLVVDKSGKIVLQLVGKVDAAKIKKIEEALKKLKN